MKMKKSTTYIPQGVCSQLIDVVVEDGKVSSVQFIGGCTAIRRVLRHSFEVWRYTRPSLASKVSIAAARAPRAPTSWHKH